MTRNIAVWILAVLAVPALGAGFDVPAAKSQIANTPASSPQGKRDMPQTKVKAPAKAEPRPVQTPSVGSPLITVVSPADCVNKGGSITLQGSNFLTSAGRSIALDDGAGTHLKLPINSWSGTSISAKVPDDSRVQEGWSYWVAMEAEQGQWLSNVDQSITICGADYSTQEPASDMPQLPVGGGSLLDGAMPPPPPTPNQQVAAIKEDVTVEPGEVVVVSVDMNEARQLQQAAQSMGFGIKRRTPLGNLGLVVSVLRVPKGTTVAAALAQLRQSLPNAWMDANHRYQLQAGKEVRYAPQAIAWNARAGCGAGLHIGLIDTAIDEAHPLFKGRAIMQRSFLASGIADAPRNHGTATASILVGGAPTGLLPDVKLHAAAVFRVRGKEVDTTAEWVVRALDWLVGEKVAVINLSIGGSRNLLLEAALQRVLARGIIIVAAAGNGGADAPPVYPAAQPGVIAVTAIDANLKPYGRDNRGEYIAYAAPGVDVWVATPGGDGAYVTGTSYAAPFVTAVVAAAKWSQPGTDRVALDRLLQSKARDLGASGRDNVFGWGLIQMPVECVRSARVVQDKAKSKRH